VFETQQCNIIYYCWKLVSTDFRCHE
jgi:hypothetical protein